MIDKRNKGAGLGGRCGDGEGQEPGEIRGDQHHGGADGGRNQGGALVKGLGDTWKLINGGGSPRWSSWLA